MKKFITLLSTFMLLSVGVHAVEKRYVSDKLFIQLRSGPSNEHRILKVLQSGEHLVYVEESGDFTLVKTSKGTEGWVRTQYLVDEPIAREKLIFANRDLENLRAELSAANEQKAELQKELEAVKSERANTNRSNTELERELERIRNISENAVALDEKVRKLTATNQQLALQAETLSAENEELRNDSGMTFLLYGGGLVVVGILAGIILPNVRSRRSNSGWA